ncbi:MAG: FHA domain-containing protein, partial [Planctomycetota bacterium]
MKFQLRDESTGDIHSLGGERISIGSAKGNTIIYKRKGVPPTQCFLIRGEDEFTVMNFFPPSPVTVNGEPVQEGTIRRGDRIGFTGITFVLEEAGTGPPTPVPKPAEAPSPMPETPTLDDLPVAETPKAPAGGMDAPKSPAEPKPPLPPSTPTPTLSGTPTMDDGGLEKDGGPPAQAKPVHPASPEKAPPPPPSPKEGEAEAWAAVLKEVVPAKSKEKPAGPAKPRARKSPPGGVKKPVPKPTP